MISELDYILLFYNYITRQTLKTIFFYWFQLRSLIISSLNNMLGKQSSKSYMYLNQSRIWGHFIALTLDSDKCPTCRHNSGQAALGMVYIPAVDEIKLAWFFCAQCYQYHTWSICLQVKKVKTCLFSSLSRIAMLFLLQTIFTGWCLFVENKCVVRNHLILLL